MLARLAPMKVAVALVANVQEIKLMIDFAPSAIRDVMRLDSTPNPTPLANAARPKTNAIANFAKRRKSQVLSVGCVCHRLGSLFGRFIPGRVIPRFDFM